MRRAFYIGLFLVCASTLMYEIVLTRLLSAVSWYYLAFVSVSTAMSGMTAGALLVQVRPDLFSEAQIPRRLLQACFAMAVSLPFALLTMLAVPMGISRSLQTLYSFLLLSAVIAIPFFFSGVVVCLSLTRSSFPIGQVYFVDLFGAAAGCFGALGLLKLVDAPSAMFVISTLVFLAAAGYAAHAKETRHRGRYVGWAALMLIAAGLNASTLYGIQPIWLQDSLSRRDNILVEIWNPISRVWAFRPEVAPPLMWGPSPNMTPTKVEQIGLLIDNDAATAIARFRGDFHDFDFLRYDVSSIAAQLRRGGEAAIIGVGGGRDVLNAELNGFRRVVGIEVNGAITALTARRLDWFSGFSKFPNFELHVEEGRSYLTRSGEKFDLIQASMVDTWASTAAGGMALTENGLYTVDGWRIFYEHLKPGGLISFSRWNQEPFTYQTHRMFSLAWGVLLAEGVRNPGDHIALVGSQKLATLIVSNRPLSDGDLRRLNAIVEDMKFKLLFSPGRGTTVPELRTIAAAGTLADLRRLRSAGTFDLSPPFDASPYFFSSVRLSNLPQAFREAGGGSVRPAALMVCFLFAALVLMIFTIFLPLRRSASLSGANGLLPGGITYFTAIGLAFMLVEMGMMQQLSIFLGHPIYSLAVVLAGLIFSTGVGSLLSERFRFATSLTSRMPAIAAWLLVVLYSVVVPRVTHQFTAAALWQRMAISFALIAPCGLLMGFGFPVGLRWMSKLGHQGNLPWMWALNGAAAVLATFVAMIISTEISISACLLTGAAGYLIAGLCLPWAERVPAFEMRTTAATSTH